MKMWIVGLPNVGKSTLFNALVNNYRAEARNFPFATIEPNIWMVSVYDERLEKLQKTINGEKIIPATVEFFDIAGLVEWASKWEWLGNKFLSNIRQVDAILQVVRVFKDDDITHVSGRVDPKSDIETINSELILADIETLNKRIIDFEKKLRADKKLQETQDKYRAVFEWLNKWKLAKDLISIEDQDIFHDLHLLTNKPFVYRANVSEDMMDISESELKDILWVTDSKVVAICAKLEEDMIGMSKEEKKEFLDDLWLISTWLDHLIKTSYDALWLQYYFTAWVKEVRAWTIHIWDTAPKARGVIHTDFEKWFIKADVVNWRDLVDAWWWPKARESGKVKLEWKDYIVQDWDVMLFKFNN